MEKTKRKRLPTEPDHEYIASELERLLSKDATDGQREILSDILLQLTNSSGVTIWTPGVVAAFYLVASQRRAELDTRAELLETLKLIEQGVGVEDYRMDDSLWGWKARRRALELVNSPEVSRMARRALQKALAWSQLQAIGNSRTGRGHYEEGRKAVMAKKQSKQAPAYGSFNSYQLTDEQIKRALQAFQWELMEDSIEDNLAGILLALLRSFTYTTDPTQRENMLLAGEEALMPYIGAVSDAITRLSIKAHKALIMEGGAH
jgi:hypothetical protein